MGLYFLCFNSQIGKTVNDLHKMKCLPGSVCTCRQPQRTSGTSDKDRDSARPQPRRPRTLPAPSPSSKLPESSERQKTYFLSFPFVLFPFVSFPLRMTKFLICFFKKNIGLPSSDYLCQAWKPKLAKQIQLKPSHC